MSASVIQGYSSESPLFFSTSALNFFGSGLSSSPFSNNVSALPEILYGPQRAHSTRVPSPVLIPHFAGFSQTGQVSRIIIPPLSSIKLAHQRATRTLDSPEGAEMAPGALPGALKGKEKPLLRNHSEGGADRLALDVPHLGHPIHGWSLTGPSNRFRSTFSDLLVECLLTLCPSLGSHDEIVE